MDRRGLPAHKNNTTIINIIRHQQGEQQHIFATSFWLSKSNWQIKRDWRIRLQLLLAIKNVSRSSNSKQLSMDNIMFWIKRFARYDMSCSNIIAQYSVQYRSSSAPFYLVGLLKIPFQPSLSNLRISWQSSQVLWRGQMAHRRLGEPILKWSLDCLEHAD